MHRHTINTHQLLSFSQCEAMCGVVPPSVPGYDYTFIFLSIFKKEIHMKS